jgi:hypothetical protein
MVAISIVVFVAATIPALKVFSGLEFMWSAIGIPGILISLQEVWKVGSRRVLIQLIVLSKNDNGNVDRSQDG